MNRSELEEQRQLERNRWLNSLTDGQRRRMLKREHKWRSIRQYRKNRRLAVKQHQAAQSKIGRARYEAAHPEENND